MIGWEWKRGDARSGPILIGRGFDPKEVTYEEKVSGFGRPKIPGHESSADGGEATPVPIPNTEVKLSGAEGSATAQE